MFIYKKYNAYIINQLSIEKNICFVFKCSYKNKPIYLWMFFSFLYQSTKLLFFNLVLVIQWLFCHHLPPNPTIITSPTMVILAMDAPFVPFPIPYTNCHDKQLKCKASRHTKESCYHCNLLVTPTLRLPMDQVRHLRLGS